MKKAEVMFISAALLLFVSAGVCLCDTFINNQTKETLHGYATSKTEAALTIVRTQEKGPVKLNLNEWTITRDRSGRNNKVIVLPVDDDIMREIETAAFEQEITADADEGPMLLLVEIDTPGGRVDLAQRMCATITKTTNCDVIAYIKGGPHGGAISAGSAVALACNKIYMANNTVIGAATLLTVTRTNDQNDKPKYSVSIQEKSNSMWRAYLASLAQQNNRPGLMARAMVDRSIAVIEVNQGGKRDFIDPVNKKPEQQVIRTWNKSGYLLTLTAQEAVDCTIADGLANSRQELLQKMGLNDANVVVDKKMANARKELEIADRKFDEIRKSLDMKIKQSQNPQTAAKALSILRGARSDFETLIFMAKKYPDMNLDVAKLESELNSVNAAYEKVTAETKNRR